MKEYNHYICDYRVTKSKPSGYGVWREGYKSSRTGNYYSWVEIKVVD